MQQNLTGPDTTLIHKNLHRGFERSYNAHVALNADGSQLAVSARIATEAQDRCLWKTVMRAKLTT